MNEMRLQIPRALIKAAAGKQQLIPERCLCIGAMEKAGAFQFFFKTENITKIIRCERNINDRLCFYGRDSGASHMLNVFYRIAQYLLQTMHRIFGFTLPFPFMFA